LYRSPTTSGLCMGPIDRRRKVPGMPTLPQRLTTFPKTATSYDTFFMKYM